MDKLYAPWRDSYVRSAQKGGTPGACVFCTLFDQAEPDEQRYILYQDEMVAVVLNLYPYNGGHLLVVPRAHAAQMHDLSASVLERLITVTSFACKVVQKALNCQAINFGANIGHGSGAGIPEHIHFHIVPRFAGDTGFFTTIGNSKQISVDLHQIYQTMKPYFQTISL